MIKNEDEYEKVSIEELNEMLTNCYEKLKTKEYYKVSQCGFYYFFQKKDYIAIVDDSLTRKGRGAYFTPTDITRFMAVSAIEGELSKGKSPLDIKLIDNSCGAGDFLLAGLDYLTETVWNNLDKYPEVKEALDKEWNDICEAGLKHGIIYKEEPDDKR